MRWRAVLEFDVSNDYHGDKIADMLVAFAWAHTNGVVLIASEEAVRPMPSSFHDEGGEA